MLSKKVNSNCKRKYIDVKLNAQTINSLLDIGSDISIIDELTWKKIGQPKLQNTKKIARGVSRNKLKIQRRILHECVVQR